ncbi:MAG: phage major capsid protein, partial [Vibrio gallaecicus]
MALPADDLVASTAKNRSDYIADGVTDNLALMYILKKGGKIRKGDFSGSELTLPITYSGLNKTDDGTLHDIGFFQGYADFDITQGAATLTHSKWEATELASYISMSTREGWQNMGEEKALDWAKAKLKNCRLETTQVMGEALYGDGTGFGGDAFDGLSVLFPADNTTGTVGGINRATDGATFWRHQVVDPGAEITSANIRGYLDEMELDTRRGSEQVDLIIFGRNLFRAYQDYLHPLQRITTVDTVDSGFATLKDMGRTVYYDAVCDDNTGYFLNTDTLEYRHPKGQWFNVGDKEKV